MNHVFSSLGHEQYIEEHYLGGRSYHVVDGRVKIKRRGEED